MCYVEMLLLMSDKKPPAYEPFPGNEETSNAINKLFSADIP